MAARREWTEWHLTPRGWEMGSTRHGESGNNWQGEPEDRVLSVTYKEQKTSSQLEPTTGIEESWRTKDAHKAATIAALLQKYGKLPDAAQTFRGLKTQASAKCLPSDPRSTTCVTCGR